MPMTARQIVDRILAEIGCEVPEDTVDTFKAGDPDAAVTGVATTFLATLDVLRRAAARGLNLVITHEPTFYHHRDETQEIEPDAVLDLKRKLLADSGLVVWRLHDCWHRREPDGIDAGVIEALGWQDHLACAEPCILEMPPTTVRELASSLKAGLGARSVRVIGDPRLRSGKVGLCVGAPAAIVQVRMLQRDDVEVLVAGEAREWETVEYVRDAADAGLRKAIILLGHCVSEEAGMRYLAGWLGELIPAVPVEFLPAGDPFWTV